VAIRLAAASRNAAADAVVDRIDGGPAAGTIEIRTGTQPATADDAATGTLLVTITLADPAFGSASAGSALIASTPRSGTAVATGTAGWFRAKDSTGVTVFDGAVTATGGGGDLTLATTSIVSGADVRITSGSYSQP
jgi:hypothetical protein